MIENFSIPGYIPGTLTAVAGAVIAVLFARNLRHVVKPNMVDVVVSSKSSTTYGNKSESGNAYWLWPEWIPQFGLTKIALPLSIFDLDLKNYEAYDEDKVPFMVDVKAFFLLDHPSIAAVRVSDMAELMEQLTGILQGTVRMVLAKYNVERIMIERSTFGELFTKATEKQLNEWGVRNAKPIELMDIRDGHKSDIITRIQAKEESKIQMESRVVVAGNNQEAETKEIAAQQIIDVRDQEAQQLVGERTAEKVKKVGIANEIANQEVKEEARKTALKDMAVVQVKVVRQADIEKEAQIVKAQETKATTIINAEADKQEDIIKAEGTKAQTVTVAEGDLADQQMEAEATLAVGTAVAEAARLLEMARVDPELALAKFIGDNPDYQNYLAKIRELVKDEEVGKEQAKALVAADVKVIANTGDTIGGVDNVMDLFSSKGGTALGSMIEAVKQTPAGEAVLESLGVGNGADL
jgi:flotillin